MNTSLDTGGAYSAVQKTGIPEQRQPVAAHKKKIFPSTDVLSPKSCRSSRSSEAVDTYQRTRVGLSFAHFGELLRLFSPTTASFCIASACTGTRPVTQPSHSDWERTARIHVTACLTQRSEFVKCKQSSFSYSTGGCVLWTEGREAAFSLSLNLKLIGELN